jgi:TatD DNase family protein
MIDSHTHLALCEGTDAELVAAAEGAGVTRIVTVGTTSTSCREALATAYYRDYAPRADQQRAFEGQIELAREVAKPLVIHTRAADEDTLRTLSQRAEGVRVILHCFSMPDRIEECLAHSNWWISFAGNVTYPRAEDLRTAALRVPAERLLVETDAPFLAPQAVRGKPNQPANVVHTARALADERRVTYAELQSSLQRSAAAVFAW